MWIYDFEFVANSEKCRKYTFLGGFAQIRKGTPEVSLTHLLVTHIPKILFIHILREWPFVLLRWGLKQCYKLLVTNIFLNV